MNNIQEYRREHTDTLRKENVIPLSAGADDGSEDPVKVSLKWFNGPKGFGFVISEDESVDIFLHVTTLQEAGVQALGGGAKLLCTVQEGPKGLHVENIVKILDMGLLPDNMPRPEESNNAPMGKKQIMQGTVKWYKPQKGFGFIIPDDGYKDAFIHQSCLKKNGVETLQSGQRVNMAFIKVPKGREVISFEVIE